MSALPPGPKGKLMQSARFGRDAYGYLVECARRHGDRFTLPLVTGPVVVIGDVDGARAVFTAPAETFDVWAKEQLLPVFGEGSIFVATGEAHRRTRRAVVASLAGLGGMADVVRGHAAALCDGETVDAGHLLRSWSLDVIVGRLFGEGAVDPRLRELCATYVEVAGDPRLMMPLLYPWLRRSFVPPWGKFIALRDELRGQIEGLLARSRGGAAEESSALAALIAPAHGLSGEEARDNLITLLIAGHETTAQASAWALDCLTGAPAATRRLLEELDSAGDAPDASELEALLYLDAVCEETLRLHPVVVQVTRVLRAPLALSPGAAAIPAGVSVSPSACLVHRRPEIYPDPEAFLPERFLERAFTPFESFPFGGGPTRCPGASFGKAEMKLILFHLLRRWHIEPCYERPVRAVVRGLVMVPDRPLLFRMKARSRRG